MAKKAKYVVIDGCIQEGSETFVKGQPYTPLGPEWERKLVEAGTIAEADSEAGKAAAAYYKAPDLLSGNE
ncbi:hypothetical protein ACRS3X_25730 [Ectopseudomonas hydrolytica]|uniref:hypothetical protein n=1 Tax=Ectopseudomonas hydrolytica TaxID=2493633 RepID=UPI003EDF5E08